MSRRSNPVPATPGPARRFLVGGLQDAEKRLARITAGGPFDDTRVVSVVEESLIVRTLGAALDLGRATWESSALVRRALAFETRWRQLASSRQRLAQGTVLLVAAVTHVGLTAWQGAPTGWLWMVPPALAIAVGALMAGWRDAGDPSRTP